MNLVYVIIFTPIHNNKNKPTKTHIHLFYKNNTKRKQTAMQISIKLLAKKKTKKSGITALSGDQLLFSAHAAHLHLLCGDLLPVWEERRELKRDYCMGAMTTATMAAGASSLRDDSVWTHGIYTNVSGGRIHACIFSAVWVHKVCGVPIIALRSSIKPPKMDDTFSLHFLPQTDSVFFLPFDMLIKSKNVPSSLSFSFTHT